MKKLLLVFSLLMFAVLISAQDKKSPKLSDSQKLAIRSAQLDYVNAQQQLKDTPQYATLQKAQDKLNQAAQDAYKEAGVNQSDFTLNEQLEFVAVAKAKAPEKEKK